MDTDQTQAQVQLSRLRSEDEARAWVLEQVKQCEDTRSAIDLCAGIREQRRLFCRWLMYQGRALGTVTTLFRCGMVSETGYQELRSRVMNTTKPTIVPFVPSVRGW